jgi:lysylphosphatidylglycerol synthetase-like protein (DUF2156 family)
MYFISSDRKALIAYTYVARQALVSGDPIGDAASLPLIPRQQRTSCSF